MIQEDYVSFEVAKLLKEKGFDEHCFCINYPLPEGEHHNIILPNLLNNSMIPFTDEYKFCRYKEDFITIPSLQMVMKWLREVHYIHTEICLYKTNENDIEPKKSRKAPYYTFGVWDSVTGDNVDKRLTNDFIGDTYEQACEAAIKYCLEYLI